MSIIFISMRPQSVAVNLILPRERTENDRGNESCLQSLNTKRLKLFRAVSDQWIVQLESFITQTPLVLLWQLARNCFCYDIFFVTITSAFIARCTRKKERRGGGGGGGGVINLCRGNFVKRRKGGEEIIWSNGEIMDKFLRFNDKTWNEFPPRKISNVSHRSSIFSRFISLRRNYAERSAGVACLFIPRDSAFFPVQFRSRNLHPPTLESSTDVPFSRCFYAGFRVARNMYLRFSDEIGCPVVSFQWCSINLGSTPLCREMLLE